MAWIANYPRAYGRQIRPGRLWAMRASETQDCQERALYARGKTQVAVKYVDRTIGSSVLIEDITTTIDGGEKAAAEQKAKFIISCGADGGMLAVQVNTTNPV